MPKGIYEREYKVLNTLREDLENEPESAISGSARKLADSYEKLLKRSEKIVGISDRQQERIFDLNEQLKEANHELKDYQHNLERKVEEEIAKRQAHERMLKQQSKMAAMGEMMDAIAHQWKQPLSILTLYAMEIVDSYENDELDHDMAQDLHDNIMKQIMHMNSTMNEFRSFFRPDKPKEHFGFIASAKSVLRLLHDELLYNKIKVEIEGDTSLQLFGVENEFKHILINLINNAKDAFNEKGIKGREIMIQCGYKAGKVEITVSDNAGGIPEAYLDQIFSAHVTTKEEGKGTGIGLYLSQQIIEGMHGSIHAENRGEGACFIITL